jgi:hypothetical protein
VSVPTIIKWTKVLSLLSLSPHSSLLVPDRSA